MNASIEKRDRDGRVSFTLFGKNLTDEFDTSGIGGGFGVITHSLPLDYRRIWGAGFNYRF